MLSLFLNNDNFDLIRSAMHVHTNESLQANTSKIIVDIFYKPNHIHFFNTGFHRYTLV